MAKRKTRSKRSTKPIGASPNFDTDKFENVLQVGGIRTGTIDSVPTAASGGAQTCRVAHVDTGAGLRFTVALDRGGDIVEASYKQHNLAYLTPNGYKTPSHAYNFAADWLTGWPGGLLTSCGPNYAGPPREEDGNSFGLHGHHSNTPAGVTMLINPDPHRGKEEMVLSLSIKDSRMFGPVIEVRRTFQCRLGVPEVILYDEVINRGNTRVAHNWIYHVNLGYPLLDGGSKFIYKGKAVELTAGDKKVSGAQLNRYKKATGPIEAHRGPGERVVMIDPTPEKDGSCHVGLINNKLKLGFELCYQKEAFPRLINWQHYGPGGSYVTGIEPLSGSLLGKDADDHPAAEQWLEPGEAKRYQTSIRIHDGSAAVTSFNKFDGKVTG